MPTAPTNTTDALGTPFALPGGASIKNRIVKAALSEQLASLTGAPTEALERLYGRWAHGGAGMLITGNVMIDGRSLGEPRNVVVEDDRDLAALGRWAAAAKADETTAIVQINHPGRQSLVGLSSRVVAPSALAIDYPGAAKPRALTGEEILELIARFAETARIVVAAGFDGVQLHGAHGYLISQFLSPAANQRDDEWGGDPERRRRFLLEVTRATRAAIGPDRILAIKLNSSDFQRGGFTEQESLDVIAQLDAENIDLLEISGGTYESPAMSGSAAESTRRREAYFLEFAEAVRGITTVPLMVTGGFRTGAGMTDAVTTGATDLVGLARPLALEPELPATLMRDPAPTQSSFNVKAPGHQEARRHRRAVVDPAPASPHGRQPGPRPGRRHTPRPAVRTAQQRPRHPAPPARITAMNAFVVNKYKGAMEAGDAPEPTLGARDVLVDVHAAGVNLLDAKIRDGEFKVFLPYKAPFILGHDVAGVVSRVGSGVTRFSAGDEIYGRVRDGRMGTFAERVAVHEDDLAIKPASLSMAEAASVPLVALTAWQALVERANLQRGQKVLIHAGSGGVGTYAIQLAKHLGATVATTTGTSNVEWVGDLGADIVIDYRTQDFEKIVQDYDVVLDSQSGDTLAKSLRVLKPGGIAIGIAGPPDPDFARQLGRRVPLLPVMALLSFKTRRAARRRGVRYSFLFMRASGAQLSEITKLIESGALRPIVDQTYPFDQAPQALAHAEGGRAKGKVVITMV